MFRNKFNCISKLFRMNKAEKVNQPYNNLTPIWDSFPINIMWQQHYRNVDRGSDNFSIWEDRVQNIEEGINMSIMLNTSSMIEGYLEEKVRYMFLSKFNKELNDFELRLKEQFFKQLKEATFIKYNASYFFVTGKTLNEIIGDSNAELWKDIRFLFQIRNIIAHSQSLEMQIDLEGGTTTTAKVIFEKKFKKIISHLQERELLEKSIPDGMLFKTMFFGSKTADYFYKRGKEFIICMDDELSKLGYLTNSRLKSIFNEYIR